MPLERSTARVLLVDPGGAALLLLTYGVSHDVPPRWITPGGGLETGEGFAAAAVREVREETGFALPEPGEPSEIVHAEVEARWHPYRFGHWAWFAAPCDRFEPSDSDREPDEREDIVGHAWFTADELAARPEAWEPADLPERIRQAANALGRERGAP